jgi:recombinational DNA repair protein (RecF pathway)
MGIMDIIKGPRCDMCGKRKSDVANSVKYGGTFCSACKKAFRMAGGEVLRRRRK